METAMMGNPIREKAVRMPSDSRWLNTFADLRKMLFGTRTRAIFAVWMLLIMLLLGRNVLFSGASDQVVAISVFFCAGSTVVVWTYRDLIVGLMRKWKASPRTKFIIIGSLGAAWAEYVFWQFEKAFGITGVAASPNLGIDWLVTMPWYCMMVALLWRAQTAHRYTVMELFVLGGVYELGADGIVGTLMDGTFGLSTIPFLICLIPMFSLVYSVMVIPCSVIVNEEMEQIRNARPAAKGNRYLHAGLPLLGLIPYFVLTALMVLS